MQPRRVRLARKTHCQMSGCSAGAEPDQLGSPPETLGLFRIAGVEIVPWEGYIEEKKANAAIVIGLGGVVNLALYY